MSERVEACRRITPELAGELLSFASGGHRGRASVLQAILSAHIDFEIDCLVWKENWNIVEVLFCDTGENEREHAQELASFVLSITSDCPSDGTFEFDCVVICGRTYTR